MSANAVTSTRALASQQLPPNRQHCRLIPAANIGQHTQQQQLAVQRRALLLGTAAVLAGGAPWLGRGHSALAQDFDCDPQPGASGIKWCDIATGFGAPAAAGDRIRVHYEGRLADGSTFASSYSPPAPLVLQLGAGEAPKGWELGILGGSGVPPMAPGTRRRLVLPPELARGGGITPPAGATVTYDITFLGKTM